ncbi:aldo/keto reductase [Flavihumibacter fluvii]|uniref:aldo/keto reductase n=1 Tax=Flavihumibacter fluvii TaxID=2838157 RepID=UPI001BDF542D|nr:aldo/keto reductase [Flavihumibacter fluvii]ULQ52043.1 aldo/keto reductase [Flavihumibacter fluvii]
MEYRQLGKSTLHISRIGFGAMSLRPLENNVQDLLFSAIDKGINFFDTADLYDKGLNETALGQALKGKRQDIILATKVGNQWRQDGSGWDWNPRKAYILKAAEESLKRLQTDYIDLYQLHGGTIDDPIDEAIEAFEELQKAGKILYYGISSIRPNVIREYVQRSHITSVMMQYSLLDRRPEESCLQLLLDHQIGVLARGTVAGGLLVNKPAVDYLGHPAAAIAGVQEMIGTVAGVHSNGAETAIQFALKHPAITAAIVGIRTPQQLQDAIQSIGKPALTAKELLILQEAAPALLYKDHR